MDLFGGRKVDKARESERIREIQQLIRDVAGDVDGQNVDVTEVREMMRAKQEEQSLMEKLAREAKGTGSTPVNATTGPASSVRVESAPEPRRTDRPLDFEGANLERTDRMLDQPSDIGMRDRTPQQGPAITVPETPGKGSTPRMDERSAPPYEPLFCIRCGTRLSEDGSCPKCSGNIRDARTSSARPMPAAVPVPRTVPSGRVGDRPVFCIYCGSRLPLDGSGCAVCSDRRWRRCYYCGAWIKANSVACPVCHRVLPSEAAMRQAQRR